jgi:uncharacterized protein YndB with AHSA1/START domain
MALTRHQYRIYVKAPIDRVWAHLVEPEFTRRYFHDTAFDAPPQAGHAYRTSMSDGRPAIDGTIEVCEPPHRLVMTWHVLYDVAMEQEPPSRVEWLLAEVGDQLTQVDLSHGDLARSPLTWAQVRHGWVWVLDALKTLAETGDTLPPVSADHLDAPATAEATAGDWHRAQAIECNNAIWELVGREQRTADDDEEMLRRAYASCYHWRRAAGSGPANEARGVYMLAKVHLLTGDATRSLHYADRCLAECTQHGLVDFDLAYAHEARARALRALGRIADADVAWAAATAVEIVDADDREIVEADFADW